MPILRGNRELIKLIQHQNTAKINCFQNEITMFDKTLNLVSRNFFCGAYEENRKVFNDF